MSKLLARIKTISTTIFEISIIYLMTCMISPQLVYIPLEGTEPPSVTSVKVPAVNIGEVGVLSVTLLAPCKWILYTTIWRLQTPQQELFGPR